MLTTTIDALKESPRARAPIVWKGPASRAPHRCSPHVDLPLRRPPRRARNGPSRARIAPSRDNRHLRGTSPVLQGAGRPPRRPRTRRRPRGAGRRLLGAVPAAERVARVGNHERELPIGHAGGARVIRLLGRDRGQARIPTHRLRRLGDEPVELASGGDRDRRRVALFGLAAQLAEAPADARARRAAQGSVISWRLRRKLTPWSVIRASSCWSSSSGAASGLR